MSLDRIYSNGGNAALIELLDKNIARVLDVGCGAGNNAALIKSRNPSSEIFGITRSQAEADIAKQHMIECWITDIERELPAELVNVKFQAIIFSHVLEHLKEPAAVLNNFLKYLDIGGVVLVAVPNIVSWRMRLQFLMGDFEYRSTGELDDTHLRFFTYMTAQNYLLSKSEGVQVTYSGATGSVPLFWLRRYLFPKKLCEEIDELGCELWPNLFGSQILLRIEKTKV